MIKLYALNIYYYHRTEQLRLWSVEITAVRIPGLMSSVEQGAGGLRDEDPGGHLRRGEQDQVLRLMELEVRRGPRRHWKLYW